MFLSPIILSDCPLLRCGLAFSPETPTVGGLSLLWVFCGDHAKGKFLREMSLFKHLETATCFHLRYNSQRSASDLLHGTVFIYHDK